MYVYKFHCDIFVLQIPLTCYFYLSPCQPFILNFWMMSSMLESMLIQSLKVISLEKPWQSSPLVLICWIKNYKHRYIIYIYKSNLS